MKKIYIRKNNIMALIIIFVNLIGFLNFDLYRFLENAMPYLNLLFIALYIMQNDQQLRRRDLLFQGCFVAYFCIDMIYNGSTLGATSSFLAFIFIILYFKYTVINLDFLKIIGAISVIVFLNHLFKIPDYYMLWSNRQEQLINPNTIGELALFSTVFINVLIDINGKYRKTKFIITLICLYVEFLLHVRSCMGAMIFYILAMFIVPSKVWTSRKLVCTITSAIIIIGCVFPILYMAVSSKSSLALWIYNITGKTFFTGREYIWSRLFAGYRNNKMALLLGYGSNSIVSSFGTSRSLESSYLGVLGYFGLIGLILFSCFIVWQVTNVPSHDMHVCQIDMLVGYLTILIVGYVEIVLTFKMTAVLSNILLGLAGNYSMAMQLKKSISA